LRAGLSQRLGSIEVVRGRDPVTKKPLLEKYIYHFERCTLCNLCVDSCGSSALAMGSDFENAVYETSQLTMILNKDALPKTPETPAGPAAAAPAAPAVPAAPAIPAAPAKPEEKAP
jgi:formate hydrogenlyase subunit 6/NADH:ubiquinone oxidoreductase subunit I